MLCRCEWLLMNSTRVPGETTSSLGPSTPADEIVIWLGLSGGDGPPGLPPPPPHVLAAAAAHRIRRARGNRTSEPDPGGDRDHAIGQLEVGAAILVDVLEAVRIAGVEDERAPLDAAAGRDAEIEALDLFADIDLLDGAAAEAGAGPGPQLQRHVRSARHIESRSPAAAPRHARQHRHFEVIDDRLGSDADIYVIGAIYGI